MKRDAVRWQAVRLKTHVFVVAAFAGLITLLVFSTPTRAAMPQFWQKCPTGSTAGHCDIPGGIATSSSTGNLFVSDGGNNRINEFTAWGEFVKAWGWGVVASGPGNEPRNEIQEVSIEATGGTFALRYFGSNDSRVTAPLAFDASSASLQAALETLGNLDSGDISVSGPAGGPWDIEFIGQQADADIAQVEIENSTLTGPGTFAVATVQDGANFEICVPEMGDVCQAGQAGATSPDASFPSVHSARVGQFSFPRGIALDSAGHVYVADFHNHRVQKFSPDGDFELMFGGSVNQGPNNPGNRCTAQHIAGGDVCGIGIQGSAPSQFGVWQIGTSFAFNFITLNDRDTPSLADDIVYVGDQGRIQKFNSDGNHLGNLPDPEGLLAANTVHSLAVDPQSGDLYVIFLSKGTKNGEAIPPNVYRLDDTSGLKVGNPLEVGIPQGVTVDTEGNVYVYDDDAPGNTAEPGNHIRRILQFNSSGDKVGIFDQNESSTIENRFATSPVGLATSSACGIPGHHLYATHSSSSNSFVRAYGPAPTDAELCPPPPVPPDIVEQFALKVGTDTATLRAHVNPHFWPDATYRVQYGLADCSLGGCAEEPLAPGAPLTEEVIDAEFPATVELKGLEPATTYHYRFLTESGGGGPVFGPDKTFRTFAEAQPPSPCANDEFRADTPSELLPNCRAFEMVSPLDKNGGDAAQGQDPTNAAGPPDKLDQSTPGGEALTYSSYRPFPGSTSGAWTTQYLARRDPQAGWQTKPLSPPEGGPSFYVGWAQVNHFQGFTSDLCAAFYLNHTDNSLAPNDIAGFPDLYRRRNCENPGLEALTTVTPPFLPANNFAEAAGSGLAYAPRAQGFSADGSRVVLRANDVLNHEATTATDDAGQPIFQLFLHSPSGLRLLSVLPDGSPATTHSTLGSHRWYGLDFKYDNALHALSGDASHAYWTTTNTDAVNLGSTFGTGGGPGRIYLRLNPEQPQSLIDAGQCTDPALACTLAVSETISADPARFHAASADGSKALFAFEAGADAGELYSFDAATQTSTLIAPGFTGMLGAADDLSRVYFASKAVLDAGAIAGVSNIYLHEQGSGLSFIGTLALFDSLVGESGFPPPSPIALSPVFRTSRVSGDGSVAIFTSIMPMTGYDNADVVSGELDQELFRYDAEADGGEGELRCLSCNPSNARPFGRQFRNDRWTAATIPGWAYSNHRSRVLSGSGSRVFFDSYDSLDPRDVNGKLDVYQWQELGTGDCDAADSRFSAPAGGCIWLITPGTGTDDSEFVDASADGSDVFIRTRSQLHASDNDALLDIYDARIGGGFAPPSLPLPACQGDACQGSPVEAPAVTGAGSKAFSGPANQGRDRTPRVKRCAKGRRLVRRKGKARCVRRGRKGGANHNRRRVR
jgi:NHL repeat